MMRPTVVSGSGAGQAPYKEGLPARAAGGLPASGPRGPAIVGAMGSCSGHSPPTLGGGRRGVAQALVGDGQGGARRIRRLRAGGGGGRLKGGRDVVGRGRIPRDGKGIEAVRRGGGDAETGRREIGHVCRVRVVLQEIF